MMKRVISFSIWGNNPMYFSGCFDNLAITQTIYPGWECWFYVDSAVSQDVVDKIIGMGGKVIIINNDRGPWYGLFWRFFPADDHNIEYFISRDTDSRLNVREKVAVDAWISSGKPFHVMRDHVNHDVPILGGMWGCKGGYVKDFRSLVDAWPDTNSKGCDQRFLASIIWPLVKDHHIGHDEFYPTRYGGPKALPFPKHPLFSGKHVGEIIR